VSTKAGILYVVATPIGNLGDISERAVGVLKEADRIAAEDTRHSHRLLAACGVTTAVEALHEHNEQARVPALIRSLQGGQSIALISDAGTPLVSDPGYQLVRSAHQAGIRVVPVPGASALLAALSASGLPTDRFVFEGFLPARAAARRSLLEQFRREPRSMVFFEAPHRIRATLDDMVAIFGAGREACLAREMTKRFETVRLDGLEGLARFVGEDADQQKGEIVLVVRGADEKKDDDEEELVRVLGILMEKLGARDAAEMAAHITGQRKNRLYDLAIRLRQAGSGPMGSGPGA